MTDRLKNETSDVLISIIIVIIINIIIVVLTHYLIPNFLSRWRLGWTHPCDTFWVGSLFDSSFPGSTRFREEPGDTTLGGEIELVEVVVERRLLRWGKEVVIFGPRPTSIEGEALSVLLSLSLIGDEDDETLSLHYFLFTLLPLSTKGEGEEELFSLSSLPSQSPLPPDSPGGVARRSPLLSGPGEFLWGLGWR